MANTTYALTISIAPWIMGIGMLYGLFYRTDAWRLEHHFFMIGSAAYIGYLWLALLMAGLQYYALPVFSHWLLGLMTLSILLCWGIGFLSRVTAPTQNCTSHDHERCLQKNRQDRWWLVGGLCAWLILLTASVVWEVILRPAVSWDTLSFWADHGRYFLAGQLVHENLQTMSGYLHPPTIKYIGAWGAYALHERSAIALYAPWAVLYVGIVMVCLALGRMLSGCWWVGLLTAVLIASNPIVQAHASLGGYADIWVSQGMFLSLAWLAAAIQSIFQPRALLLTTVLMLTMSLAVIKGHAAAYSIILMGSLLVAWAPAKGTYYLQLGLIGAGIFGALLIWNNGLNISLLDYRVTFMPDKGIIALGQREVTLSSNSWSEIARNVWHSWMINSSFYFGGVSTMTTLILVTIVGKIRQEWVCVASLYLLIGLIIFFMLGQHLNEEQLFSYAHPHSDTTLSRLTMLIYFILVFTLTIISATITRTPITRSPDTSLLSESVRKLPHMRHS